MNRITTTTSSPAPPHALFELLVDGTTWPRWGRWTGYRLVVPDARGGAGVGSERELTSRAFGRTIVSRERITRLDDDHLVEYELVSGLPLRGYVGRITLTPVDGGTTVDWSSTFDKAPFGRAAFYRAVLTWFVGDAARRLSAQASAPQLAA